MSTNSSVFISYAEDTKPLARELTSVLESQGIEAWVDFKDLRPGQLWKDQLDRAIGAAEWLLIIVGPSSRATGWQEAEWSAALAHAWSDPDQRVLPVVVGQSETPPFLRNWVALRVDPVAEPTTWTCHVLEVLRSDRSGSAQFVDVKYGNALHWRLDEIKKAAEELRQGQSEESPLAPNVSSE